MSVSLGRPSAPLAATEAAPMALRDRPAEAVEELLNVYDDSGRCVGVMRRKEAKSSNLAVGAVNLLAVNARGHVLLQRRPLDKENGGRWDKTVGGHVSAGESWDETIVREAGEELFEAPETSRVQLAADVADFQQRLAAVDLARCVLMHPAGLQLNLRDVRIAVGGGIRRVRYHVGVYLGRTDVAEHAFHPQASEIDALRYFAPEEVDTLLLRGELAPNMAFLWLSQGHRIQQLAARG